MRKVNFEMLEHNRVSSVELKVLWDFQSIIDFTAAVYDKSFKNFVLKHQHEIL